jgi:hypothetical protein
LDRDLVFKLLVIAEGFTPTYSAKHVDPSAEPIKLILKATDLDRRDPKLVLRGRIVDDQGRPLARAQVEPNGLRSPTKAGWGGSFTNGIDPLAVTNEQGEFKIGVGEADSFLDLRISARGFARRNIFMLPSGPKVHEIRLERGLTVTGRVLKDGKPVPGIGLGLCQQDRGAGRFFGDFKISTDSGGTFSFPNLPTKAFQPTGQPDSPAAPAGPEKYFLYGLMDSCKTHGALPIRAIEATKDGDVIDIKEWSFQPGVRVSGRVELADGKPVPKQTRVFLSGDEAWDLQMTVAGADGTFTFGPAPEGRYTLSVQAPGYHVSRKNASTNVLNPGSLLGVVRGDAMEIRVLLEPGEVKRDKEYSREALDEYDRRRKQPLVGIETRSK